MWRDVCVDGRDTGRVYGQGYGGGMCGEVDGWECAGIWGVCGNWGLRDEEERVRDGDYRKLRGQRERAGVCRVVEGRVEVTGVGRFTDDVGAGSTGELRVGNMSREVRNSYGGGLRQATGAGYGRVTGREWVMKLDGMGSGRGGYGGGGKGGMEMEKGREGGIREGGGNRRRVSYGGLKREGKIVIRSGTTGVGDEWGQVFFLMEREFGWDGFGKERGCEYMVCGVFFLGRNGV
jgi:hypothetical protein